MRARRIGLLTAAALPALIARAPADTVAVTVVDLADGVAYVTPGRDAGLAAGAHVALGGRTLIVLDATATTAALRLEGAVVPLGATGVATVVPPSATTPLAARAAVRPLDAWRGQWPDAVFPATLEHPTPVPLGGGVAPGRIHAAASLHGRAAVDRGGASGSAVEARLELSATPWAERPLAVDVDVAARWFGAGRGGARTPVMVRTAQVRWGDAADPRLAIGRLAWAADAVGMLDGVRLAGTRGTLELAGFGGVVPDPVDGRPDTSATRFGLEASWDQPAHAWQPRLVLTALGSTWAGALDERVVTAAADARHGELRLGGWGEAQQFAAANPWGAAAVEVTGAGASVGWHRRDRRADLDLTFQRPQRSRRLAAALPAAWLCYPATAAADAPCAGDDWWADVSGSAGLGGARWSLDGTATLGTTHADGAFVDASALVLGELRVLPGDARLLLGASGGRARFLDSYGLELGVAVGGGRRWDLAARWRPELIAYTGALDRFVSYGLALDGRYRILRALDLSASALLTTGEDRDALAVLTTLAWRPRP